MNNDTNTTKPELSILTVYDLDHTYSLLVKTAEIPQYLDLLRAQNKKHLGQCLSERYSVWRLTKPSLRGTAEYATRDNANALPLTDADCERIALKYLRNDCITTSEHLPEYLRNTTQHNTRG